MWHFSLLNIWFLRIICVRQTIKEFGWHMRSTLSLQLAQLRLGDRIRVRRQPQQRPQRTRLLNSRGPLVSSERRVMKAGVIEGIVIELHRFGKHPRMLLRRTDLSKSQDVFISLNHHELQSIEHLEQGRVHMVRIKPIRQYAPVPLVHAVDIESSPKRHGTPAHSILKQTKEGLQGVLPLLSNE